MSDPLVYRPQVSSLPTAALVGGKAANLARLSAIGQPVPPFFALTTAAFRAMLDDGSLVEPARRWRSAAETAARSELEQAADELRGLLCQATLPDPIDAEIRRAYREMFPAEALVAVRSSAADEDAV